MSFRIGIIVAIVLLASGCGSSDGGASQTDLLDVLSTSQRRHDPVQFEEVDLGEFYVTRHNGYGLPLFVRFHMYGVVPSEHLDEFEESLHLHVNNVNNDDPDCLAPVAD